MQLAKERDGLSSTNLDLSKHRDQLNKEKNELSKSLQEMDEWIYYKSSLYFISTENKSWTESRRYCTERGADLIIINNREEQGFVKKISAGVNVWIGLTDGDVEGRWKWVDSSTLTAGFWASGEPNSYGGINEDCAVNYEPGWADYPCNHLMQWVCEKVII
ncbi:CD209 antigen-like protein 2 [Megalobrama amblycephala]|uniref:CD209 antigen-like protein 2 n=1 Tax=Megalobrama amblycephala TaxID=75352 RepID=UPI00201447A0|nr:CD209 antigen-like protein 2 [Megalobrama amblycephala]